MSMDVQLKFWQANANANGFILCIQKKNWIFEITTKEEQVGIGIKDMVVN